MAFIPVIRGGAVDFLVDFFMQRWQKGQMLHVKKTYKSNENNTNLKIHKYFWMIVFVSDNEFPKTTKFLLCQNTRNWTFILALLVYIALLLT